MKCSIFWENQDDQNRMRTFELLDSHGGKKHDIRNKPLKVLTPEIFMGKFFLILF